MEKSQELTSWWQRSCTSGFRARYMTVHNRVVEVVWEWRKYLYLYLYIQERFWVLLTSEPADIKSIPIIVSCSPWNSGSPPVFISIR